MPAPRPTAVDPSAAVRSSAADPIDPSAASLNEYYRGFGLNGGSDAAAVEEWRARYAVERALRVVAERELAAANRKLAALQKAEPEESATAPVRFETGRVGGIGIAGDALVREFGGLFRENAAHEEAIRLRNGSDDPSEASDPDGAG